MNRFDLAAKEWDSKSRRVNIAKSAVSKIKEIIDTKGMDILDYGCGTGLISFGLSEDAKSVVGMDSSEGMLDVFDKKAKDLGFENVSSKIHDANRDDFKPEQFDLIAVSMTLHHIKESDVFIQKCNKALKKGGFLCINDLYSEDGTFHDKGNEGVEHFGFCDKEMKSLYEKSGFDMLFLEEVFSVEKRGRDYPVFLAVGRKR